MALVRLRDSSSLTSPGSVLYLRGTMGCTGTRLSLVSLASPAEGGEPVEEVEADGDNLDGDEDQDPERVLEGLQEGDQLARPRLLHAPGLLPCNLLQTILCKMYKSYLK